MQTAGVGSLRHCLDQCVGYDEGTTALLPTLRLETGRGEPLAMRTADWRSLYHDPEPSAAHHQEEREDELADV